MQNRPVTSAIGARPEASEAFTLIEIVIAVFILAMLLLLAVPSLTGVIANKRLKQSLDDFNTLVRQAQERSVTEHRAYLIVWRDKGVTLRPEVFAKGEKPRATAELNLRRGEALKLSLPAALTKDPLGQWIFWPTGTCEPAIVQFEGHSGTWTAAYPALTARSELKNYAAR